MQEQTVDNILIFAVIHNNSDFFSKPYIDSAAVISEDENELTVFAINRSLDSECALSIQLLGSWNYRVCQHIALEGGDLKAVNTADEPQKVIPIVKAIADRLTLSPHSWNMILLKKQG